VKKNISIQRQTQQQTHAEFASPIAPRRDMRQAEYDLAMTESVIAWLPTGEGRTIDRVAVLIGVYPGTEDEETKDVEEEGDPLL